MQDSLHNPQSRSDEEKSPRIHYNACNNVQNYKLNSRPIRISANALFKILLDSVFCASPNKFHFLRNCMVEIVKNELLSHHYDLGFFVVTFGENKHHSS